MTPLRHAWLGCIAVSLVCAASLSAQLTPPPADNANPNFLGNVNRDLVQYSLDTVKGFLKDSTTAGFKL